MQTNFSHSFNRHLLATNLVLIIILFFYNLLGYLLPIIHLSIGSNIIILLGINLVLIGLRLIANR